MVGQGSARVFPWPGSPVFWAGLPCIETRPRIGRMFPQRHAHLEQRLHLPLGQKDWSWRRKRSHVRNTIKKKEKRSPQLNLRQKLRGGLDRPLLALTAVVRATMAE